MGYFIENKNFPEVAPKNTTSIGEKNVQVQHTQQEYPNSARQTIRRESQPVRTAINTNTQPVQQEVKTSSSPRRYTY